MIRNREMQILKGVTKGDKGTNLSLVEITGNEPVSGVHFVAPNSFLSEITEYKPVFETCFQLR